MSPNEVMKNQISIRDAKTHLSKLLKRVAVGEEIIITKSGVPIARLTAVETSKSPRRKNFLGIERKRLRVPPDFDAPLPADLLAAFGVENAKADEEPK